MAFRVHRAPVRPTRQNPVRNQHAHHTRPARAGKYGQPPNELIAPYDDGMRVLLKAMSISGAPDDPAKVHAALGKALPMASFMGSPLTLSGGQPGGNQVMTVNQIGVIRNGEPVAVAPAK